MLISVIVPNYNHARFLPKRIESILKQTFQNFELIILDDCSKDESQEIIKQYARTDSRISYYFNDQNSGSTFKQWNKGVKLAKGDYVWIAESDDWADASFLEKLINAVGESKNIGIAYAQSYEVNEEDQIIVSRVDWTSDLINQAKWLTDYQNSGVKEINENFCLKNTIPNVSACIIKRDAYISIGMANGDMKYAGDWDLYIRILMKFDIAFVAAHLNYNRRHELTQRAKKTYSKLAISEILMILRKISPVLLEDKKKYAYKILAERWANSLYHDASTYSVKEMLTYYSSFRSVLNGKKKNIYFLMLRRVIPL